MTCNSAIQGGIFELGASSGSGRPKPLKLRIELRHIERFWFAVRSEMSWLSDPDLGRRPRHRDRATIRWNFVGDVVQKLGRLLAAGELVEFEDSEGIYFEFASTAILCGLELSDDERNIIESWFTLDEAPQADPWSISLVNGRHRLWGVWSSMPQACLPIVSDHLMHEDAIHSLGENFRRVHLISRQEGLRKIPSSALVRNRSKAYFRHLELNAE